LLFSSPFFLFIALALFATAVYLGGSRKTRRLIRLVASELEDGLAAVDKEYINIGGLIGYHGNFSMKMPFREAKTTFTFIARHSLLFYPFSRIFSRHDKLYVNIFSTVSITKEGHILLKKLADSRLHHVAGGENLLQEERIIQGKEYIIYYENDGIKKFMEQCIQKLNMQNILHFAVFPGNDNFYLYMIPIKEVIRENLKILLKLTASFLEKDQSSFSQSSRKKEEK